MLLLTITRSIAEEERRARANDREYNEKFQYAVSVPYFRAGRGRGLENRRLRLVAGWEGCLREAGNDPSAARLKFSGFLLLKQNPWT